MNISNAQKKINNLVKIKKIIKVSKLAIINDLQKYKKVSEEAFDVSFLSKKIFEVAQKKYNISSELLSSNKNKKKPTVWVYITLPKTLLSISYDKYDKIILNEFNNNQDLLITIGHPAIKFAKKHGIPSFYAADDLTDQEESVSAVLTNLHLNGLIGKIQFVLISSKMSDEPLVILPIDKSNINKDSNIQLNPESIMFPSLDYVLESLTSIYIHKITAAIFKEGHFFYLQQKLISHESSIDAIDKKIEERTMALRKTKRKIETDEMILIVQNVKRKAGNNE